MRLDLHEIINIPGEVRQFDYEPDMTGLSFDCVLDITKPVRAVGKVENIAGVLTLTATVTAELLCECARCLCEFRRDLELHTSAVLADEINDNDNIEIYLLDGDFIDLDEVIVTDFVLNMEQRQLCSEDCKGLCERCGKNLNEGPCDCKAESDPRLAALAQLLEKE